MADTVVLNLIPDAETNEKEMPAIDNTPKPELSFESLVGAGSAFKSRIIETAKASANEIENVVSVKTENASPIVNLLASALAVEPASVVPWVGEIPEDVEKLLKALENPLKSDIKNLDINSIATTLEEMFEERIEEEEDASVND